MPTLRNSFGQCDSIDIQASANLGRWNGAKFSKLSWRAIKKHANRHERERSDRDSNLPTSLEANESDATISVPDGGDITRHSSTSSTSALFRRRRDGTNADRRTLTHDRRLDPLGLTAIYTPPSLPSVDIIFVHGLGGSSRLTWAKNHDLEHFWPSEWLPLEEDVSSARIFSFGYDSQFMTQKRNGVVGIADFAKDLLHQMRYPPNGDDKLLPLGKCPIIFVTHSMGGLVFKQAYLYGEHDDLYKHIISSIRAVVFLATPHRGTHLADSLNRLLRASMIYSSQQYISEMNNNAPFLRDINEHFRRATPRLQIHSFYETLETEVGGTRMMVLKQDSAVYGYVGESSTPLKADHHDVCKYDSPQDINYKTVVAVIKSLVVDYRDEGDEVARDKLLQDMKTISEYLSVSQTGAEHDFAFFRSRRSGGTCKWIRNTTKFRDWAETPFSSAVLWLHAKPGRGKSVLSAYLINRLLKRGAAVQYFFFRFGEQRKRSVGALLGSLAIQLAQRFPAYRKALVRLKNSGFNPKDPVDWKNSWQEFLKLSLYPLDLATPVYWVIDGIDEADVPESIFEILQSVNSSTTPIRILLVSRWSTPLSVSFERLKSRVQSSALCVDESSSDIRAYTEQELEYLLWSPELKDEVAEKIARQANGNFLWVHLAMEEIKDCDTMDSVETALYELPDGMEALYARMVISITESKRKLDVHLQQVLFNWAIYCTSAVSRNEMIQALKPEWSLIDLQGTISRLCGHFLVVEGDDRIRFVHETARDYLKTRSTFKSKFDPYQAHYDIFRKSIFAFTSSDLSSELNNDEDNGRLNALEYRATSWPYHLSHISMVGRSELTLGLLVEFFSGTGVFNWIRVVASLNKLNTLIEASRRLSNFTQRLRRIDGSDSPPYPMLADAELIQLWTRDLLKLVAKFGSNLLQQPTAIYDCIPSFCPRGSGLFRTFQGTSPRPSIAVSGQSEDWDDCLSRVSVGSEDQALMLTCSRQHLAVLNSSGTTSIWDSVTLEELRKIPHHEYVHYVCFSQDGSYFASYGDDTTKIWNAGTGELIRCILNASDALALDFRFASDDAVLLVALGSHAVFSLSVNDKDASWAPHGTRLEHGRHGLTDVYITIPTALSFSPDGSKVAAIYRRFPLTVWSLGPTRLLKRLKSKNSSGEGSDAPLVLVDRMQWHPNNKDILAILSDGYILKWDTDTDHKRELERSTTTPSNIQCSPDGRVFATADMRGTIKLYDHHTFVQLYQLSCQQVVEALHFSLDSRRFYDIRGNYCNVWEPNVLVRLSNMDDHLSDAQSEGGSIAQSNLHSEVFADTVAPITALSAAGDGKSGLVSVGTSKGDLEIHDYTTGIKTSVRKNMETNVGFVAWSGDGSRFVYEGSSGSLNLCSVTVSNKGRDASKPHWETEFLAKIDLPFEYDGIKQVLFSPDGSYLLVSFAKSAHVWDTLCYEKAMTVDLSSATRWVEHPSDRRNVLSVTQSTITAHTWPDLSEVQKWNVSTVNGAKGTPALSALESKDSNDIDFDKEREELICATLTHSRTYLLLTISRRTYTEKLRPRFAILDLSALNNTYTCDVPQIELPKSITTHLERPLNVLDADTLIFVDRAFWIRSVHLEQDLLPPLKQHDKVNNEYNAKAKAKDAINTIQVKSRVEAGIAARVKRHFFIPRDWITTQTLDLLHLAANGTIVLPRHGEVVVIRSALRAEC